ncbi:threonine aldolase family protein [Falsirhodobacter algicola]|uniref:L-threonine aldolase n=1 Tax=Falsirhodobacter algicola TaxID=2692330 RepID=A0A8J8MSP4_9RHOB|nr:beta-eliminating lyase-related protein [Falsirhodobacter algicola]QUS35767.1 low specificity L-threonine aldolase [Falsirhodobacter algicola]
MFFASDNASAVPPQVIDALARANDGYEMPYGNDTVMTGVRARLREVFEAPEAAVYLVSTGTAANVLSLACLCPPWGAVLCHDTAHVQVDECNAPEAFMNGGKLLTVPGDGGRIDPEALKEALARLLPAAVHNAQPAALTLTNTTEMGTVYSPDQVAQLAGLAKGAGLSVHMDGARFANALVSSGATPAEMTWKAGVDVLSFGGTKNGLMGVEAVILFDPAKAQEFEFRRKRGAQLFSKHRYLSAQMQAYLADDLWLDLAKRANRAAARLADGIAALPGGRLMHPVEANMLFAEFPAEGHARATAAGATYYNLAELAGGSELGARLVTSWSTSDAEVDAFLSHLRG